MAHGDYNCCMICDSKMDYNGYDAETKETPCTYCLSVMRDMGEVLLTPDELIKKIDSLSKSKALVYLHHIGYEPCYYDNPIDTHLQKLGLVTTKAKEGKWGKRLKKLPQAKQEA